MAGWIRSARLRGHRRGDRLVTKLVDRAFQEEPEAVIGLAQNDVFPHVRAHRGGRLAVEIDELMHILPGQVDLHRAEAGNAAHQRIDGGLDQGAGDRRIDRIAAFAQHVGPGLDGLRLGGGDQSLGHSWPPSIVCSGRHVPHHVPDLIRDLDTL
jgi:hypothetical protein